MQHVTGDRKRIVHDTSSNRLNLANRSNYVQILPSRLNKQHALKRGAYSA